MNTELLTKLTQPFAPEQVRNRKGANGKSLDYLETHSIISRLNACLEGKWSFDVLEHWVFDREVVVRAKLTILGDTPLTKTVFGSHTIKRYESNNEAISLGDDMKSAASDALKKAATLLGVGLELYERKSAANGNGRVYTGNAARPAPTDGAVAPNANPNRNGSAGSNGHHTNVQGNGNSTSRPPGEPLSVKQMKLIYQLAKKRSLAVGDLNGQLQRDFGRASVDELTKQQASDVIDGLQVQQ